MAMDFFEAQAEAHRTTLRLMGLFGAAVLVLVILTVVLITAFIAWSAVPGGQPSWGHFFDTLSLPLALGIAVGVVALVTLSSIFRLLTLSEGGRNIAKSLDGRLVRVNTTNPGEKRLLNVVEEIAIASGLPVPPVYVLDEPGINAFAAGYAPHDAIIGVTQGTLELLNRDELQGVIGHEFSHILNGDMRLNMRLTAVLFGILVIGIIGRSLLGRRSRNRNSSRRSGGSPGLGGLALGLGLMLIGYSGTFFGNLIKAAVSRQREFLADASAVQFTRNPDGITGALRKIAGHTSGSHLFHARAGEMSHMFFGQSVSNFLGHLGATHPPIDDRIRSVHPAWDGSYIVPEPLPDDTAADPSTPSSEQALDPLQILPAILGAGGVVTDTASAMAARLGKVTADDVARARELISGLPRVYYDAAHDACGARAAIYTLLIPDDTQAALSHLDTHAEPDVFAKLSELIEHRSAVPAGARMTLIHIAMPTLKTLSRPEYDRFRDNLVALIKLDGSVSRFEWILHQVVVNELRPHFQGSKHRDMGTLRIEQETQACWVLLSLLAHVDQRPEDAEDACRAGLRTLGIESEFMRQKGLAPREDANQKRLTRALRRLRLLHPLDQPKLLKAAIVTVEHNGRLDPKEYELLAGIAASLDCPLPPLQPAA